MFVYAIHKITHTEQIIQAQTRGTKKNHDAKHMLNKNYSYEQRDELCGSSQENSF
jgi:hypothetical protein